MHVLHAHARPPGPAPGTDSTGLPAAPVQSVGVTRAAIRKRWCNGVACVSETRFALAMSLVWTLVYNVPFWRQTVLAMWHATAGSIAFLASLFMLVVCLQATLLLIMPTVVLMRAAASFLFLVAAAGSYFCGAFGAILSTDMLRNVLETDPAEVGALVSGDLVLSVTALGVLPALLVWRVPLCRINWARRIKQRAVFAAGAVLICVGGLFACSANYAVFFRGHKPIRFTLVPAAPVSSMAALLSHSHLGNAHAPLLDRAGRAVRVAAATTHPLVMLIVVGETARALNFQLGGYYRATTPELQSTENVVYLGPASSCGTSTAWSVPCMFSHQGRQGFDADTARQYTNVLDALVQAGFDVEWRDNNSGCKGVCARVKYTSYSDRRDGRFCPRSFCYDEVMLTDLGTRLRAVTRDTVIVLHQIGSHGPAYAERYPPEFERFKPACHSNDLQRCTDEEIVNAYDNTIAYTDHVLAQLIALLRETADKADAMLIYVSDHGESLGEQGLYLHGMPYALAPRVQKEVPMLLWTSKAYDARVGMHSGCVQRRAQRNPSHDNLYHTILGAAGVSNQVYDRKLDLLAGCTSDSRLARVKATSAPYGT